MTVALSIKINDGVVLAADSATTLIGPHPTTGQSTVFNVYNNANKIFNLCKGLPIGAVTWGAGSIGNASISTLVKDLRLRFSGDLPSEYSEWELRPGTYTVESVANRFREFFYDELYVPEFEGQEGTPDLGFLMAGYSSDGDMAEEYELLLGRGECVGPRAIRDHNDSGIYANGQPQAINRLLLGFDPQLAQILRDDLEVPHDQVQPAMEVILDKLRATVLRPAMPIQDAIELADFLVDLTIKYARFSDGPDTVGGPTEVGAITKHEGFKWIQRKYYFDRELNPEGSR